MTTLADEASLRLPRDYRVLHYASLGSTNDEAKRLAMAGALHGTVVTATVQESGRGRQGRHWVSPPGNLFASLILRPSVSLASAAQLGFAAALAIGDVIAAQIGDKAEIGLKWPNDVLLDRSKIAGVLLETSMQSGALIDWIVVGIGINLVAAPTDTPYPAIYLGAFAAPPEPGVILVDLVRAFDGWYRRWHADGFAPLRQVWLDRAVGAEGEMQVRLGDQTIVGRFQDLDQDGTLLLATAEGVRRISAGDVYFRAA